MAKTEKKLATPRFRAAVTKAIRSCQKSRAEVAGEMTGLLLAAGILDKEAGQRVTARMLDCFTSPSKKAHRFPAEFIEALCEVTGDFSLLDSLETAERLRQIELGRRFEELMERWKR